MECMKSTCLVLRDICIEQASSFFLIRERLPTCCTCREWCCDCTPCGPCDIVWKRKYWWQGRRIEMIIWDVVLCFNLQILNACSCSELYVHVWAVMKYVYCKVCVWAQWSSRHISLAHKLSGCCASYMCTETLLFGHWLLWLYYNHFILVWGKAQSVIFWLHLNVPFLVWHGHPVKIRDYKIFVAHWWLGYHSSTVHEYWYNVYRCTLYNSTVVSSVPCLLFFIGDCQLWVEQDAL